METITKIEEVRDGFWITTTSQVIKLSMDTNTSCCENPGYFISNDDLGYYVGARLVDVTLTDTALSTMKLERMRIHTYECIFVNIITDRGVLQFTAYNQQNGYYGHRATVESHQLSHSVVL